MRVTSQGLFRNLFFRRRSVSTGVPTHRHSIPQLRAGIRSNSSSTNATASQAQPSPSPSQPTTDDDILAQLTFSEEPLGLPASRGYGYFRGGPGLAFGPDNRYVIQAKLGYGTASSIWLAKDLTLNRHVTIKILTGYSTFLNDTKKLRELESHRRLYESSASASASDSTKPKLPYPDRRVGLRAYFYHPGIEAGDGEHLCIVMEPFRSSMQDIRDTFRGEWVPIPAVKRMLRQLLEGIANLHVCGIAHTDIKPDNIMIDFGPQWPNGTIDPWIKANPPRTYPPERSLHGMVSPVVSQSFPPPALDELSLHNFKLSDYSSAQFVDDKTTDHITPLGLRPPEVVLGGEWNESVDIWTYGCMVYTLVTSQALFQPQPYPPLNASEEDVLLYQMILFCGEFFQPPLLKRCARSLDYFEPDCAPKKFKHFPRKTFQQCLLDGRPSLDPEGVEAVASLMTQCLRLDPADRLTAHEILKHPWLAS